MCRIYGTRNVSIRGRIYFENQNLLAFDMGQKCTEYPVRKNSKFSNVLDIQNMKCVYMGDDIF